MLAPSVARAVPVFLRSPPMRLSMLPVSITAHFVAFAAFLFVPLAGGVEAPTPWPLTSSREFITAAPAPPPRQVDVLRASGRSSAAPIVAPDRFEPEPDEPPAVYGSDPLGDARVGLEVGLPEGLTLETLEPPPAPPIVTPPPPGNRTYRPGGAIRQPRKIRDAPAVYPEVARVAKIQGLVILEATIDERGIVTDARVLRSVPLLDAAALDALKQWRYTPTLLNGVPVRVLMTVTFRFSLGDRDL
jgi:protein TonB